MEFLPTRGLLIRHGYTFRFTLLRRLRLGVLDGFVEPCGETRCRATTCWADEQKSPQRFAGDVPHTRVRPFQEHLVSLQHDSDHQSALVDPAAHMAVEHEAQPTEHALLFYASVRLKKNEMVSGTISSYYD